ncbi:MAG: A/G-specific adenine glycosylase [Bacteroidota bacterium]|nr:A/G-specific adenine glycosylase [Bacteroidota bacterium]
MDKLQFTCQLAQWHTTKNKRELPWKGEKDAYKIWLSEIILQQTRAAMGVKYYETFIKKYPTIVQLADAPEEEVFKLWEGLGYYSRCRNLMATARLIVDDLNGRFPHQYENILALKGVGPYTAAAIASFAFGLPYAVVDGNVFRVLARCFGNNTPIDSNEGKQLFTALANEVLDKKKPAQHNQAIMDFGATVCKPVGPLCDECPLQNGCNGYLTGRVNELPVKEKTINKRTRWFTYFIFTVDDKTMIHQRTQKDIWQQLYEFYLVETAENKHWKEDDVRLFLLHQLSIDDASLIYISPQLSQQLTHQTVNAEFIKIKLQKVPRILQEHQWVSNEQMQQLPFPKIINEYLQSLSFQPRLFS